MGNLEIEKTKSYTHEYFEKQLDALGLCEEAIRYQDEKGLRNCLRVADQAIEKHQSFGELEIRVPSEDGEIAYPTHSEAKIKIGILPLLLERYKLILKKLEQYDYGRSRNIDSDEIDKIKIRRELTKIAQSEIKRWLWVVIIILIVMWVVMFLLIQRFGWNLLEPWTYLIGIGFTIVGYAYLAVQQREFSPFAIYQHALEARKKQLFKNFGVDH